jgi:hypothetical protein
MGGRGVEGCWKICFTCRAGLSGIFLMKFMKNFLTFKRCHLLGWQSSRLVEDLKENRLNFGEFSLEFLDISAVDAS